MAAPESSRESVPLEYLKQADKAMAAGNGRDAAGLMWKAIEATIIGLARENEIKGENLDQLAQALDARSPEEDRRHMRSVVTGVTLLEHSKVEVLEECELELAYQLSHDFVANW